MNKVLHFNVKLEDIIPLESDHVKGLCVYVLFNIKNNTKISYRASKVIDNGEVSYCLTEEYPNGNEITFTI